MTEKPESGPGPLPAVSDDLNIGAQLYAWADAVAWGRMSKEELGQRARDLLSTAKPFPPKNVVEIKRKIVSLHWTGSTTIILADDGTAWHISEGSTGWSKYPDIPPIWEAVKIVHGIPRNQE
jgi:hypothetical protein